MNPPQDARHKVSGHPTGGTLTGTYARAVTMGKESGKEKVTKPNTDTRTTASLHAEAKRDNRAKETHSILKYVTDAVTTITNWQNSALLFMQELRAGITPSSATPNNRGVEASTCTTAPEAATSPPGATSTNSGALPGAADKQSPAQDAPDQNEGRAPSRHLHMHFEPDPNCPAYVRALGKPDNTGTPRRYALHVTRTEGSDLLIFTGLMGDTKTRFLIDGGSETSFVDTEHIRRNNIRAIRKTTPDTVLFANGATQDSNMYVPNQHITLGTYTDTEPFHTIPLDGFDATLGKSWLRRLGPHIDWKHGNRCCQGFQMWQ